MFPLALAFVVPAATAAVVRHGPRSVATAAAGCVGYRGVAAGRLLGAWTRTGTPSAATAAFPLCGGRCLPSRPPHHRRTPPLPLSLAMSSAQPPAKAGSGGTPVGNSMMDVSRGGAFVRKPSVFRDWVRADGSTPFAPASGRYILYVTAAPLGRNGVKWGCGGTDGGREGGVSARNAGEERGTRQRWGWSRHERGVATGVDLWWVVLCSCCWPRVLCSLWAR